MRTILILAVIALTGCASENVRVSCEGRLELINPRTARGAALAPPATATTPGKPPTGEGSP